MTIEQAALTICRKADTIGRANFKEGAEWAIQKALDILDEMFMEQGSISVDDWFRDSKNLFQGREVFKNKMTED